MPTSIASLLDEGIARLERVAAEPRREAEILLAAALGRARGYLLAHPDESVLDCDATDRYEAGIVRRAHGEPIAYILGEKEFWSLTLAVTPAVLVPRPETELLVERALAHVAADTPARILDLGTGSGAIALAIAHERPRAHVLATDASGGALEVARGNAARLHLRNVEFRAGAWYAPVPGERFTLVVSNPPYIAVGDDRVERQVRGYEPHAALYSGADGLDALRVIVGEAPRHLVPGGWLIVEHGDRQGPAVRDLFAAAGFRTVATHHDLAGLERCTEGRATG